MDFEGIGWYRREGCKNINKRLYEIIQYDLEYVVVDNLFTEQELNNLEDGDITNLIPTLKEDGMNIRTFQYEDKSLEYRVYLSQYQQY